MNRLKIGSGLCGGAVICALLMSSCHKEPGPIVEPQTYAGGVQIALSEEMPDYIMPNLDAYVFRGGTRKFSHKLIGVTKTENLLSAKINTGTWEMVLLSHSNGGTGKITPPKYDESISEAIMWKSEPNAVDGVVPVMPEIFYASTGGVTIEKDKTAKANVTLARNMARVKIAVVKAYGFEMDDAAAANTIFLGNVPTTLAWDGTLVPNAKTPDVAVMRHGLKFLAPDAEKGEDFQRSETVEFLIPAHRGTDWKLLEPADTLKRVLTLSVNLKKADGSDYVRENFVIPITPKMNRQMLVKVTLSEKITVGPITVSPWVLNDIGTDPY